MLFLSGGASHALGNLAPLLRRRGFFFCFLIGRGRNFLAETRGASSPSLIPRASV